MKESVMSLETAFPVSIKVIAAVAVAAFALLGGCAVVPGPHGVHVVGPRVVVAAPAPVYVAPVYAAPSYYPAPVYVAPPVFNFSYGRSYYYQRRGGWYR
jgi:hypothetical protein